MAPVADFLNVEEIFAQRNRTVLFKDFSFAQLSGRTNLTHPILNQSTMNMELQRHYFHKLKDANAILEHLPKNGLFNLVLSNQGGTLPHHHGPAINVMFHGAKRWVLVDPFVFKSTKQRDAFELLNRIRFWDATHKYHSHEWFRDRVLQNMTIPYYDFVLEQGDALFIPRNVSHATTDLCRETVAVVMQGAFLDHRSSDPYSFSRAKPWANADFNCGSSACFDHAAVV
eukprot:gnl/TRDRNA2_/TRDRNA2_140661_c0_seq1.p1 gnl/TRDRNA2_/TRDRNA2_140661_c0~~gnl/TRDRNA2_/TRDRNA2_140661_c0_seq1.p1  ORF type:complete len:242 (+),score=15.54 gnl/TRDRNA2_/TRDRNA2_140661_c0_seq1:45-728(+)